jgi:hypothetical protein
MGLHRRRNHWLTIRICVPAAMPAESSKRLSHRNMRKRISIIPFILSGKWALAALHKPLFFIRLT